MSIEDKIVLDDVGSQYASTQKINENFSKVEEFINNEALSRDNSTGSSNQMDTTLDMNSEQIINLPQPTEDTSPVRLTDLESALSATLSPVPTEATTAQIYDTPKLQPLRTTLEELDAALVEMDTDRSLKGYVFPDITTLKAKEGLSVGEYVQVYRQGHLVTVKVIATTGSADEMLVLEGQGVDLEVQPINGELHVDWAGCPSDGTNAVPFFRAVDAYCGANGCTLTFDAAKQYTFTQTFSGDSVPYTPVLASWKGLGSANGNPSILPTHAASLRTFRTLTDTIYQRAKRLAAGQLADAPAYEINEDVAGTNYVQFTNSVDYDAAITWGLESGQLVRVAFGKNCRDADDSLWDYDQLHRVVRIDATSKRLYLESAIDRPITSNGWFIGSDKNDAPDWADAESITAGDYRYDSRSCYRATTTGTTSGASLTADTGVEWERICTELAVGPSTNFGNVRGEVDGTPLVQLMNVAIGTHDIVWENVSIKWPTNESIGIDAKSAYNWKFIDCVLDTKFTYITEASRYIEFYRCGLINTDPNEDDTAQVVNVYQARKVKLVDCYTRGGGYGSFAGNENYNTFVESFAQIEYINCDITMDYDGRISSAAFVDRGEYTAINCNILGTTQPVRTVGTVLADEYLPLLTKVTQSRVSVEAADFRLEDVGGDNNPSDVYNETNVYLINNTYQVGAWQQDNQVTLTPKRYMIKELTFTPTPSASNLEISGLDNFEFIGASGKNFVLLGVEGFTYDAATANNCSIQFYARHETEGIRKVFSTATDNLLVLGQETSASRFISNGTGKRLIQTNIEKLEAREFTGVDVPSSITLRFHVLV